MINKINYNDKKFNSIIEKYLSQDMSQNINISKKVSEIINDVKLNGERAVRKYSKYFDNFDIEVEGIRIPDNDISAAKNNCDKGIIKALKIAADRIAAYQKRLVPSDFMYKDSTNMDLGCKWTSVDSCGLYVPGGKAVYPSSVLMNAIPAKLAGVKRLVMTVPAPSGFVDPLLLVAAEIAGINEVYKVGGAQAIASLAFGIDSIKKVDKIVGPGNAYVAEAKRQVYGVVGIDSIAGPSEILIVADSSNNPEWIALDLLSQAEHDELAKVILITDSNDFAILVEKSIEKNIKKLQRKEIAKKSIENNGLIIIVPSIKVVPKLVDIFAPEHLEVLTKENDYLIKEINNAGAIFVGPYTPEAVGDYIAGPSHVLPTNRSARFDSGLSVLDFLKRTSIIKCTDKGIRLHANSISSIAKAEGLDAHANSVLVRIGANKYDS